MQLGNKLPSKEEFEEFHNVNSVCSSRLPKKKEETVDVKIGTNELTNNPWSAYFNLRSMPKIPCVLSQRINQNI